MIKQWPYQESDHQRSAFHRLLCLEYHRTTVLQGTSGATVSTWNGSHSWIIRPLNHDDWCLYVLLRI